MKEDCQQMTQLCLVCKELNPKAAANPNIDPEQPKTDLQTFKSVGLGMYSWKWNQCLLVFDRMSGYIMVEISIAYLMQNVTTKFKLLCLIYRFPCHVRYNKGPQFRSELEALLKDINIEPSP